jgi:hypothetical protein
MKRSIKELVSGITKTKYVDDHPDGRGRIRGLVKWFNNDFKEFADRAKEHIGVSHDARLAGTRSRVNGRVKEDIAEIVKAHSVDWVVYPSAGGGIEQFYATEGIEPMEAIDWDSVTLDMVEENAPKLATAFKEKYSIPATESKKTDDNEDEKKESKKSNGTPAVLDEKAVEEIVTRALESVSAKSEAKAAVQKQVSDEVNKSTLPDKTKQRVIRSFENADKFDADRVKEAIEEAKEELKAAGAGPKVTGVGPSKQSGTPGSLGRVHEAVEAAFSIKKSAAKNADKDPDEEAKK